MADLYDSPEFREWAANAKRYMIPGMRDSEVVFSLVPDGDIDPKFCVELGAAIMLDKPILAMVRPGAKASKKLMQVADKIIECDPDTDQGRAQIRDEIEKFIKARE